MIQKHTHKLKLHKYKSGNAVFFCILPDCTFKIKQEFSLNKSNICHRCENKFNLNEYSIRLVRPHCPDCHQPKGTIKSIEPIEILADPSLAIKTSSAVNSLRDRLSSALKGIPDEEGEI